MSKFYRDIWCLSSPMQIQKITNTFSPLRSGFLLLNSIRSPKRCAICTTSLSTNSLSALIANPMFASTTKVQNLFQTTISASFAVYYSYRVQNLRGQVRTTIRRLKDILGLIGISKASKTKKEATWSIILSRKIRLVPNC